MAVRSADRESADPGAVNLNPATVSRDPYEMTDEEIELLQQLGVRREEIERRQRQLEQREVLLLHRYHGFAYEEVSARTESTVAAVKQKAYRALKTLRAAAT